MSLSLKTSLFALALAFAAPGAHAAVLTFDDFPNIDAALSTFTYGGLTFTAPSYQYVWDATSPNSNGTPALIAAGGTTITRTGGGLFDLVALEMSISWYDSSSSGTVTINGVPVTLGQGLASIATNLSGVSSVTISGLGTGGYWLADNIEVNLGAVPVPAGLPLLASGLAAMGLVRRRKRA